jgi:hypothetical protein
MRNKSNITSLSIYYQNVRGLRSKVLRFYNSICSSNIDIIGLTETWLSGDICTCELFPGSYSVLRSDRNFSACGVSKGGGVLLAVKSHLNCSPLNLNTIISTVPSIDMIGAKIVVNAHSYMSLLSIFHHLLLSRYLRPSSNYFLLLTMSIMTMLL